MPGRLWEADHSRFSPSAPRDSRGDRPAWAATAVRRSAIMMGVTLHEPGVLAGHRAAEHVGQGGIELRTSAPPEFVQSLHARERAPVEVRTSHRLKAVDEGEGPVKIGNRLSAQFVRISSAVPPFVVVASEQGDVLEAGNGAQHGVPDRGMSPHGLEVASRRWRRTGRSPRDLRVAWRANFLLYLGSRGGRIAAPRPRERAGHLRKRCRTPGRDPFPAGQSVSTTLDARPVRTHSNACA